MLQFDDTDSTPNEISQTKIYLFVIVAAGLLL